MSRKIEIEIPDWVPPERTVHILSGTNERIGYIEPYTRRVFVKVSRCMRCGKCCEAAKCPELTSRPGCFECGFKGAVPAICVVSEPRNIPECSSKYKEK